MATIENKQRVRKERKEGDPYTFSTIIPENVYHLFKELERATGIPREHLVTSMITILANNDAKIVNEVITTAHNLQLDALQAKMRNGGFFSKTPVTSSTKPDNTPKGVQSIQTPDKK